MLYNCIKFTQILKFSEPNFLTTYCNLKWFTEEEKKDDGENKR